MIPMLLLALSAAKVPDAFVARGPGGGGALFSPSLSPDGQELTVSCDMSELFRSADRGKSWELVSHTQFQGGRASAVRFSGATRTAIDQTDPSGGGLARLVRSTDGTHWAPLPSDPTNGEAYDLLVDPSDDNHLLVFSYGSLYSSIDGAKTWSNAWSAMDNGAGLRSAGAYWDDKDVYLGTNDGLLVSHDFGKSFSLQNLSGIAAGQKIVSLSGGKKDGVVRLLAATASSGDVYAGMMVEELNGSALGGLWTWSPGEPGWKSSITGVDPVDRLYLVGQASTTTDTLFAAGGHAQSDWPAIYKSVDGGAHWTQSLFASGNRNAITGWAGSGGDRDWSYGGMACGLAVAVHNGQALAYTDYGFIHVSDDGGASWRQAYLDPASQNPMGKPTGTGKSYRSAGLENTTAWSVAWADSLRMFAGFSDIRGVRSTDGGVSWGFGYTGHDDNSMYRVVRAPDGTMYAATSTMHDLYQSTRLADAQLDAAAGHILSSKDSGRTWSRIWTGKGVAWIELDPANPRRMYASVFHSTQGGVMVTDSLEKGAAAKWTLLAKPQRTEGHPYVLAVLPDGSVLSSWSGRRTSAGFTASSGVFRLPKGSTIWQDLSDPGMKYWTKDVVVDPADRTGNTWWVAVFSGWGGAPNGLGGVYRTTDAGGHWSRVWESDRVESVGIPPDGDKEIYATTETQGLWHAADRTLAAPAFSQVGSYPFRQPVRVFFNPYDPAEMWVASFGNSLRMGRRDGKGVEANPQPIRVGPSVRIDRGELLLAGLAGWGQVLVRVMDPSGRIIVTQIVATDRFGSARVAATKSKGFHLVRLESASLHRIATFAVPSNL